MNENITKKKSKCLVGMSERIKTSMTARILKMIICTYEIITYWSMKDKGIVLKISLFKHN